MMSTGYIVYWWETVQPASKCGLPVVAPGSRNPTVRGRTMVLGTGMVPRTALAVTLDSSHFLVTGVFARPSNCLVRH